MKTCQVPHSCDYVRHRSSQDRNASNRQAEKRAPTENKDTCQGKICTPNACLHPPFRAPLSIIDLSHSRDHAGRHQGTAHRLMPASSHCNPTWEKKVKEDPMDDSVPDPRMGVNKRQRTEPGLTEKITAQRRCLFYCTWKLYGEFPCKKRGRIGVRIDSGGTFSFY